MKVLQSQHVGYDGLDATGTLLPLSNRKLS